MSPGVCEMDTPTLTAPLPPLAAHVPRQVWAAGRPEWLFQLTEFKVKRTDSLLPFPGESVNFAVLHGDKYHLPNMTGAAMML